MVTPIVDLLKQGVSPRKIAQSLAAGFVLSTFPILGTTTGLCLAAAHFFKLNHVAVQLINYLSYPLQIILVIPFLRLGDWIFGYETTSLDLMKMWDFLLEQPLDFFKNYGGVAARAIAVWALLAPPALYLLLKILTPVLQKAGAAYGWKDAETESKHQQR